MLTKLPETADKIPDDPKHERQRQLLRQCRYRNRVQNAENRIVLQHELRNSLLEYIELFYNRKRLYSALGDLSPAAFMRHYDQKQPLAF